MKKIAVRRSKIQGRGVFALEDIARGTRIVEYTGELVSQDEANARYGDDDKMDRHHTFLFGVNNDIVIDATHKGSPARFINHSCDPNCEAVMEDDRIFIEAIKNIKAGQELGYDYNLDRPGRWQNKWWDQYACRCGSRKCRGILISAKRKAVADRIKSLKSPQKKSSASSKK